LGSSLSFSHFFSSQYRRDSTTDTHIYTYTELFREEGRERRGEEEKRRRVSFVRLSLSLSL
jgi:hypothetical protein